MPVAFYCVYNLNHNNRYGFTDLRLNSLANGNRAEIKKKRQKHVRLPMLLLNQNFNLFRHIRTKLVKRIFEINERSIVFYEEMPKSKEYLSSDDSDSEVEKAPKRKRKEEKSEKAETSKKPKKTSKADEEEPSWDIGNKRFVKIRQFKGKLLVDIREMYMDKDGEMKPGKKGISLSSEQWRKFVENVEEVNEVFKTKC